MKTIAYCNPFVPAEWIAAHGMRPLWMRLRSTGDRRLLGGARGVCPFAAACIDAVRGVEDFSALVLTTTCDQMRYAAAVLERDNHLPLFLMNVPSTWQTAAARQLYRDEVERLGRFLVRLGGRDPSGGDLAAAMLRYDQARLAVRAARPHWSARQFAEAVIGLDGNGKPMKEKSGSSAYVPKEPEKDTQLQYALSFLRGTATDAQTAGNAVDPQKKAPIGGTRDNAKN